MIERLACKITKSKYSRGLFITITLSCIVLLISSCSVNNFPVSGINTTVTASPLPTAMLTPTATEDPFKGLGICRTCREAANCPITEEDFRRISDYVKANFEFPAEALRVSHLDAVPLPDRTSFITIHIGNIEDILSGKYTLEDLLSKVGKPFFFNLKSNPPRNNYDNLIAVFPVNNADGSLSTYTIIRPPRLYQGFYETAEDCTEASNEESFSKMPYTPPVYDIGRISEGNIFFRSPDSQGSLITEIVEDTKNQEDGERKKLIDEWLRTCIIPFGIEEMPLLGSDFDFRGFPLDVD